MYTFGQKLRNIMEHYPIFTEHYMEHYKRVILYLTNCGIMFTCCYCNTAVVTWVYISKRVILRRDAEQQLVSYFYIVRH